MEKLHSDACSSGRRRSRKSGPIDDRLFIQAGGCIPCDATLVLKSIAEEQTFLLFEWLYGHAVLNNGCERQLSDTNSHLRRAISIQMSRACISLSTSHMSIGRGLVAVEVLQN